MAASSMDDSAIRDLERQCRDANAAFHAQADVTIRHADIVKQQVSTGKFRLPAKRSGNSSGVHRRADTKS